MNRLLSYTEQITRTKPCRVVFDRWGKHLFGGSPEIKYHGVDIPYPIHHIFTIDTCDTRTPLVYENTRYVPLVYPLPYSVGGGHITYRIAKEFEIEILELSEFDPDHPKYFLLDRLLERRCSLKTLSYAENRIYNSSLSRLSFLDRLRKKRLWNFECFRVSGILEYCRVLGKHCTEKNSNNENVCSGWVFACFPATKIPFGDIWHEYSSDVSFNFAVCTTCGAISAYNTCT